MSRVAPDLPELRRVPEAARPFVYLSAMHRARRSPATWMTGALVVGVAVGIGANQGYALFGKPGSILGILAGLVLGVVGFFKLNVPWHARRLVPSVIEQESCGVLTAVREADEKVRRIVDRRP